ncbi:MAG: mannosyltransferase [Thermoanaerobaculia bacterium]|jgi:hypothetical protein|nr:mannosyltransferase [Thermoanaerobaculia bacterium]
MKDERLNARHPSSFRIHPSVLIAILFLALRIPLLAVRAPFFDELFTRWIAGKPFAEILAALRYDSGPPLYYFVVHMLGDPAVEATRVVSLLCAAISLSMILRSNRMGPATGSIETPAILAATLLAVFPPAVLFAGDARAYAMCAMLVTGAVLAIDDGRSIVAAVTLVLAAYSHYYGVLFFPLLLLGPAGVTMPKLANWSRRGAALAIASALFIPGLLLALRQPGGARAWMAAEWPDALFVRQPLALAIIGAVAFLLSLRVNRYLLMVIVPLLLAIALRVYVPIRFEVVIAAPLALWLGESLRQNRFRMALMAALIAVGASWSVLGFIDHLHRPPDSYREAALWTAKNIAAKENVVASGYCYLETLMNGHPRVTAFPPEQALHPGWRALPPSGLPAPRGTFFWIGERQAPELAIFIRERRDIRPLFINDRAMVALVR